jgi:hypothetical protein
MTGETVLKSYTVALGRKPVGPKKRKATIKHLKDYTS